MANTNLPVVNMSRDGVVTGTTEVTCNPANHHTFSNDGQIYVNARNSDTDPHTVSLIIQKTVDGQAVSPKTVTVAAGKLVSIGPFNKDIYNVKSGGDKNLVYIDGNDATLKFQAIRMTRETS